MLVSERIHICLQYCCPTNVRCWKCQDRSGLCLPPRMKTLTHAEVHSFCKHAFCKRRTLAFLLFGGAPVSKALNVKLPSPCICNFLCKYVFCLQRERVLHGEFKHEVEKIWLWWRMSGQLGMCISFFIQIVLRSFLPLFHPLFPILSCSARYHYFPLRYEALLRGTLRVFLCEKHITVFLLLNVTGPTFTLCSRLGGNERSIFCQVL